MRGRGALLEALGAQVAPAMQSVRLAEQLRTRLVELQATAHQLSASRRRLVRAAHGRPRPRGCRRPGLS